MYVSGPRGRGRSVGTLALLITLMPALVSVGCAARVSQFDSFATAGLTYVKASDTVLDEAGTAAIRADNAILVKARPDTATPERRARVLQSNRDLQERMAILRDLRRHGRVLQRYFEALAAIADSKAPEAAAAAAEKTFGALGAISVSLQNSALKPVVPTLTKLAVGSFKVRILEDELRRRSDSIAAEIKLQEVLFKAIGELLKADIGVQLNTMETGQVITPFAVDAALPEEWGATREQFIKGVSAASSAGAAARAAQALLEAFTALVENRFDRAAFNSLLDDIGEMLTIAEQLAPHASEE